MLNERTLFVFGAGASVDFGMPLGDGLSTAIAKKRAHLWNGRVRTWQLCRRSVQTKYDSAYHGFGHYASKGNDRVTVVYPAKAVPALLRPAH